MVMPEDRPREAPSLDVGDAAETCARLFFRPLRVRPLVGYADANFMVTDESGARFVLKISGPDLDLESLELQVRTLRHLEACGWDSVPRPVASLSGAPWELSSVAGASRVVRMLSYVAGEQMAKLPELRRGLLESLGRFLGRLDLDLARLDDVPERFLDWDLANLSQTRPLADNIKPAVDRELAVGAIERFLDRRSSGGDLRRSLIHHDANTHNVLVSSLDPASAEIAGLIDFGDLAITETVFEVAVAAAYAALDSEDPWEAVLAVTRGYVVENPLLDAERRILFAAVCARLALSVSMSATRRRAGTADSYALVSERQAWVALRRLTELGESEAQQRLREALETEEMPG